MKTTLDAYLKPKKLNLEEISENIKKQDDLNKLVYFYNTVLGDLGFFPRICGEWELEDDIRENNLENIKMPLGINYYIWLDGNIKFMDDNTVKAFVYSMTQWRNLRVSAEHNYGGVDWINEVYEVFL